MPKPTEFHPGVTFVSRARRHVETLKAGRPVIASDGTVVYSETKEIEFTDYVYKPRTKEEFDLLKASWEKQWGHLPNDGVGTALWEELGENVAKDVGEVAESRKVQVVGGVRSTTGRGPIPR